MPEKNHMEKKNIGVSGQALPIKKNEAMPNKVRDSNLHNSPSSTIRFVSNLHQTVPNLRSPMVDLCDTFSIIQQSESWYLGIAVHTSQIPIKHNTKPIKNPSFLGVTRFAAFAIDFIRAMLISIRKSLKNNGLVILLMDNILHHQG